MKKLFIMAFVGTVIVSFFISKNVYSITEGSNEWIQRQADFEGYITEIDPNGSILVEDDDLAVWVSDFPIQEVLLSQHIKVWFKDGLAFFSNPGKAEFCKYELTLD